MIADKTASLLSASCMLGYLSVQDNNHKKENLKNFGNYLGISYQLKDDLFDVLGKIEKTGKSAKMDLKKNILTLPYIHMLNKVNKRTKKNIISKLKYHFKRKDLKEIEHLNRLQLNILIQCDLCISSLLSLPNNMLILLSLF